jgi:hypothetical protein
MPHSVLYKLMSDEYLVRELEEELKENGDFPV